MRFRVLLCLLCVFSRLPNYLDVASLAFISLSLSQTPGPGRMTSLRVCATQTNPSYVPSSAYDSHATVLVSSERGELLLHKKIT